MEACQICGAGIDACSCNRSDPMGFLTDFRTSSPPVPPPAAPPTEPAGWDGQPSAVGLHPPQLPPWPPAGPYHPGPPYRGYFVQPTPPIWRRERTIAIAAASCLSVLVLVGVIAAATVKPRNGSPAVSSAAPALPVGGGPTAPTGFTTFHSSADGFTIAIPETWKAVDPTSPGAQAAMNEMEQSNPNLRSAFATSALQLAEKGMALLAINPVADSQGFASNVSVDAQPDLTYSSGDLVQIASALPGEDARLGATMTGTSYVSIGGHEALRASSTLPVTTPAGAHIEVAQTQYYSGANGFVYIVTLTGSDADMAAIAASFRTS